MNPAKFNFDMYRGDSYSWRFIFWNDEGKNIPIDLTDAVVELEIKDKVGGSVILPMPLIITLPNIVDVNMTPDLYALCPPKGVWDMQITFLDGQVHTPIGGSVSITPDVTGTLAGKKG